MEDFTVYHKGRDGVIWYRCTACGYLTRGKPRRCPVCEGKGRMKSEEDRNDNLNNNNVSLQGLH